MFKKVLFSRLDTLANSCDIKTTTKISRFYSIISCQKLGILLTGQTDIHDHVNEILGKIISANTNMTNHSLNDCCLF